MSKKQTKSEKLSDLQVGDQLVERASHGSRIYGAGKEFDPNRIVAAYVVTDIWYDPVEEKQYHGLARIRNDLSYGKPTQKRTVRGLVSCGLEKSDRDWIEHFKTIRSGDNVVQLSRRRDQ